MLSDFKDYLSLERRYSPRTQLAYVRDLEAFEQYLSSVSTPKLETNPESITAAEIRSWVFQQSRSGISFRSLRRKLSSIRSYFRFLRIKKDLRTNPVKGVLLPKTPKKLAAFIPERELQDVLDEKIAADWVSLRNQLVVELLYGCGLRRSELLSLTESDIDWNRKVLKIRGKGNKERISPFGEVVSQCLTNYLLATEKAGFKVNEAIILTEKGEPAYPKLIERIVKAKLSGLAGKYPVHPHVLRHSYATHLLNNGAELPAIRELLGHSSLASTQVYLHNSITTLQKIHKQAHPKAEIRDS
ncbi:MAG: tyrosine-type recombinase/integrase [Bacteroidia bacterium]|nr:tyrosine-type recombinase/integrase [Bacteroidia bacterium]